MQETKNTVHESHDTIHTFKNYFITVFSVSVKISCIQTDPNSLEPSFITYSLQMYCIGFFEPRFFYFLGLESKLILKSIIFKLYYTSYCIFLSIFINMHEVTNWFH